MRAEKETMKAMSNLAAGKDHSLSNDEVLELVRTLGDYRAMACHFADILAASAEVLLDRKSTSNSERGRQASIVLQTLGNLKYETNQRSSGSSRHRDAVIDRLQRIVDTGGRRAQPLKPGHSHTAEMRCCEPCPAFGQPVQR